jgi:hypothetical protein
MQSYIYCRIEIYWDAYLSLGFQVGGVSKIVVVQVIIAGLISSSIPSDMNSNGSVKSAL